MKNFLKNALPRSVQLLFFWVSASIMSDVFNIQGLKCGYRTKIKVVVEKFFGRPSEESWLSRLSLRVKVVRVKFSIWSLFPINNVRPLVPPCLPSSDKLWTADLRHRMFTLWTSQEGFNVSARPSQFVKSHRMPQNHRMPQICCNPHLFCRKQKNEVFCSTYFMNIHK